MPRMEQHLTQARRNEEFAHGLLTDDEHIEWVPVVAFYAAWHYVHAYFATQAGIPHTLGHDGMQRYVSTLSVLKPVEDHYYRLFNECNNARYNLFRVYRPVARGLLEIDLVAIREAITPHTRPN